MVVNKVRIGIDIGGTFTDFVSYDPSTAELRTWKRLSTPENPERAVLDGLSELGTDQELSVVHGSTVATNAVLERKGALTALITTQGLKDLLTIGRQNRQELYDLFSDRPDPLVPQDLCFEVRERIDWQGAVQVAIDPDEIDDLIPILHAKGVESVAVSLLFAFLYPAHEAELGSRLRAAGFMTSLSHETLPEFREYERTSTTVVNAYVAPMVERYLDRMIPELPFADLRIMQSNGGCLSAEGLRQLPVTSILSGPSAGVIGSHFTALQAGIDRLITFDMGGTSTDVCLVDQHLPFSSETTVGGCPIRIPVIDIHSIGSGGGSIAYRDAGGSLRVGPRSAGASPGPVCYDQGGQFPTVTDANLICGRLPPDSKLAGEIELNVKAAEFSFQKLAQELILPGDGDATPSQIAALGVIQVVNAHMARAIRAISADRGYDPREFTLISFGGAGGLHASQLAREVGIRRILIPKHASTFSALGMLSADIIRDYVLTVMVQTCMEHAALSDLFEPLMEQARLDLGREGFHPQEIRYEQWLDLRYVGQSYEVSIPRIDNYLELFHQRHLDLYAHADREAATEIVNIRLRAIGPIATPEFRRTRVDTDKKPVPSGLQPCLHQNRLGDGHRWEEVPLYPGQDLVSGHRIKGPAIIMQPDTTIYLQGGDRCSVDTFGNLILTLPGPGGAENPRPDV